MNSKTLTPIIDSLIQSLQTDDDFNDDSHEMLSPAQIAEELGMHKNTIYRIIGTGQLKAYNLSMGSRKTYYRIRRVDLENYLDERYCVR